MSEATIEKVLSEPSEVTIPAGPAVRMTWYQRLLQNRNVVMGA